MLTGIDFIIAERERQVKEGWSISHDCTHNRNEELACAAASYATPKDSRELSFFSQESNAIIPVTWPWNPSAWKPTPEDRIKELAKAGALIAAEIDRLLLTK